MAKDEVLDGALKMMRAMKTGPIRIEPEGEPSAKVLIDLGIAEEGKTDGENGQPYTALRFTSSGRMFLKSCEDSQKEKTADRVHTYVGYGVSAILGWLASRFMPVLLDAIQHLLQSHVG